MINKDSTFKEIKIFMDTIDEMTKDPSGTYWMSFSHNNVEYELYGTPNFLNNGELNFQCYIDEQEAFVLNDEDLNYKFETLTKEDYIKYLNKVINLIKRKK